MHEHVHMVGHNDVVEDADVGMMDFEGFDFLLYDLAYGGSCYGDCVGAELADGEGGELRG